MIFGRLPLAEAEGAILAHGLTVGGTRLKKGHVLTGADIELLNAEGRETILATRIEARETGEDAAAEALARAARGHGCTVNAPFTGRCNIYAQHSGIVEINADLIDRTNAIDESITIATLRPFELVEKGQMLATVKIIPFAVPDAVLARAVDQMSAAISVSPFGGKRVGILSTRLPETKESVIGKGVELMRRRTERCEGTVGETVTVEHHERAVAEALAKLTPGPHDIVVIFSASAISDRRDVIPAGIEAIGGKIDHYGMPVDPGNLMLLGHRDAVRIIGAPGCARSPKENGFDWVFQRLCADIEVSPADVMAMGVGGLLVDTGQRGAPRDQRNSGAQRMPRVAAILLAAGQSRRMGEINKLLTDVQGQPMIRHAYDAIRHSTAEPVIVVTGHEQEKVRDVLSGTDVIFAHNALHAEGLSTSLGAGLLAVPADCEAVVVCLGDMPRITSTMIDRLISAYNPVEGRAICVPTRHGKRGNPVLFDRRFFAEVLGIGGDVGARHLIGLHEDLVAEVPIDDDAIFLDVDTPEALSRLT
ncbi:NTP transferase domain-containing protein [Minwuia sp.]|uniref:NTP transferase domain-containing protein n=1 Tax=Minwuia sp. TaxID=2493630 RepID=UPI003A950EE7